MVRDTNTKKAGQAPAQRFSDVLPSVRKHSDHGEQGGKAGDDDGTGDEGTKVKGCGGPMVAYKAHWLDLRGLVAAAAEEPTDEEDVAGLVPMGAGLPTAVFCPSRLLHNGCLAASAATPCSEP